MAAAQHAADAGQQFARYKRFWQIVIGAHLEAENAVERLVAGGQHDHRQRRMRAQLAAQREAVVARQVQVEDDQVGTRLVQGFPYRVAVGRGQCAVTVRLEVIGQQRADVPVVVDNENGR